MFLLGLILSLSTFLTMTFKAVEFHKATVCRQDAWLKSFELKTETLLTDSRPQGIIFSKECKTIVSRQDQNVSWRKLPFSSSKAFVLDLKGKL